MPSAVYNDGHDGRQKVYAMETLQLHDPALLRKALGCFATGVAVVTGQHPEFGPVGLTISSFNSVSLDPPLILWSIRLDSPSRAAFQKDRLFAVNVLAADQKDTCLRFARSSHSKFDGLAVQPGLGDVPRLEGSLACFECRTDRVIAAGDHELYIGHVLRVSTGDGQNPLIFHRSQLTALPEVCTP